MPVQPDFQVPISVMAGAGVFRALAFATGAEVELEAEVLWLGFGGLF